MKATLERTEDIADNIKSFWFKPQENLSFTAGQFARWYLPHENADQRGERRWFTISSSPSEGPLIALTTKFVSGTSAEKGSSYKSVLKSLQPGDAIDVGSPLGDFVLPKDSARPLVFIAGGIGITPFRSIAKYLSDTSEKRNIHLIYAVSRPEEIAYKELLVTAYEKVSLIVGERLNGEKLVDLVNGINNKLFYFSGPEPMVKTLVQQCRDLGLSDDQIVLDYFPGYQAL